MDLPASLSPHHPPPDVTAVIGALVLAAAVVVIPLPDQPGLVFVAIFFHSVGFALTSPAMPSLLSRSAPCPYAPRW